MKKLLNLALLTALSATAGNFITIGDLGNPGKVVPFTSKKGYPRGTVSYPYRIAETEVTNAEYVKFLNAVAASDPDGLYNPKMRIRRTGNEGAYRYEVSPEDAEKPVNHVSRVDAARYCNWLSRGPVYRIFRGTRPNGSSAPGIIGWRDLTTPDSPRLYFLPDMHEFYKAGFYDGKGGYPVITKADAGKPSHYGIRNHASGVSEWMENKYYAGAPVFLGANDKQQDPDLLNTIRFLQRNDNSEEEYGGFRVASTSDLAIAPLLNTKKNFFFADAPSQGELKIRSANARKQAVLKLEIRDARGEAVSENTVKTDLKQGVSIHRFPLPAKDGYYELSVFPDDPAYEGKAVRIPFAVMREKMPDYGADGDFGFTVHLQRWANSYTNELPDFDILRELGVSIIRNDAGNEREGARDLFRVVRKHGFRPLLICRGYSPRQMEQSRANSAVCAKWAEHGIAPEFANAAEEVFQMVQKYKNDIHDWELGNEPYYWKMMPEDYAQYAKTLAKAIRLADPQANIILGDVSAHHDPVLRLGTGKLTDAVAAHIYGFYVPGFWGIAGKCRQLNSSMEAAGIAEKPVWLTEIGVSTYSARHVIPQRSPEEVARYIALHVPKTMVGGKAFGASKVLVYTFRDVPLDYLEEDFGMTNRYGLPKPGAAAYRTTARMIGDAAFRGFIKGHSFAAGKIAGFAFRDKAGRDVLAFWRNDAYGYDRFEIPFAELIHPAETVRIKASGDAELVSSDGVVSTLKNRNGEIAVPVDEYPVFVRGKLTPELETVKTTAGRKIFPETAATVRILPDADNMGRGCDEMKGVRLNAAPKQAKTVTVRIYNQSAAPLTGTIRLDASASWREFLWKVTPAERHLTIPADGMGTATFTLYVPADFPTGDYRYLTALFQTADGRQFTDRVMLISAPAKLKTGSWCNYSKGFQLKGAEKETALRLSWIASPQRGYGNIFRTVPYPFAASAKELKRTVEFRFLPETDNVKAVSLLLLDHSGETFQLKQELRNVKPGVWQSLTFKPAEIFGKKVIRYGGKRNGTIDFPIRFLGFNVDLRDRSRAGDILVRPE